MTVNYSNSAFYSSLRTEYIGLKNHVNFTTSAGNVTVPITHNLGYIPYFRLSFQFDSDNHYYSSYNGPSQILNNWEINSINATTTQLIISITNVLGGAHSGTAYYRIYAEPQS